jgi:DNA polymerase-3 subunit epsilon
MSILKAFSKNAHGAREVILDIETTGLFTKDGHRIVEVAAVEMRDRKATGREFHALVNPARDIPADIVKIHGISNEKVKDAPKFSDIAAQLRDFVGGDPIVITCRTKDDYTLDIAFLNVEMEKAGQPKFREDQWVNVRRWSETMFGEKSATLDKVLDKYGINRKERDDQGHSAILDARLLSEVYPRLFKDFITFTEEKAAAKAEKKPNP